MAADHKVGFGQNFSSACFAALLVAGLTLSAGACSSNAPLVAVGESTDTWQRSHDLQGDCVSVPGEQVFIPEQRVAASAIHSLQDASVLSLSDGEAGNLLGVNRDGQYPGLAQQLLTGAIAELSHRRKLARDQHQGSWSEFDEQNLAQLRRRLDGFDEQPLSFYLVRALAADAAHLERIDVWFCGETILTRSLSPPTVQFRDVPDRLAIVVLLEARPGRSVAEWTYNDPELNH